MSTHASIKAGNICTNSVGCSICALGGNAPDHLCLDGCTQGVLPSQYRSSVLCAHGKNDVVCFVQSALRITSILALPVCVLDQSRPGLPDRNGFVQGTVMARLSSSDLVLPSRHSGENADQPRLPDTVSLRWSRYT